jgi:hypothetical protein
MAHGRGDDISKAAQIAFAAQLASLGLDDERGRRYVDLVLNSLSDAARRELIAMDPAKYEYLPGGAGVHALTTHSRFPKRARTPLVKDGEDFDDVSVVDEIDGKRETPHKNAASLKEDRCVREWVVRRPFYRSIELEGGTRDPGPVVPPRTTPPRHRPQPPRAAEC